MVDWKVLTLVDVVHRLDLALLDREQLGRRAGLLERLAGLGQLNLLDALGGEDGDLLALKGRVRHACLLGRFPLRARMQAWRNGRTGPLQRKEEMRQRWIAAVVALAAAVPPRRQPRRAAGDVAQSAGIAQVTKTWQASVTDIDGDGHPDLYLGRQTATARPMCSSCRRAIRRGTTNLTSPCSTTARRTSPGSTCPR